MAGAAAYRPLRLEIEGRAFHSTLFARLHTSKAEDSDLPAQRTLFAVNVPHGATEAGLQAAFERLGAVSEVRLSSMTAEPASSSSSSAAAPAVTSTAHVVFETAEALKATLKSTKALRLTLETAATKRPTESREVLQKAVDGFLKRFEAAEKQREKEALDAKGKMDADGCARYMCMAHACTRVHVYAMDAGAPPSATRLVDRSRRLTTPLTRPVVARSFVVVGRKGKPLSAAEADQKPLSADQKKKRKKDNAVTPDFYHFQQHERKREQLVKLREQFEADKARIAKMKSERKFRPY